MHALGLLLAGAGLTDFKRGQEAALGVKDRVDKDQELVTIRLDVKAKWGMWQLTLDKSISVMVTCDYLQIAFSCNLRVLAKISFIILWLMSRSSKFVISKPHMQVVFWSPYEQIIVRRLSSLQQMHHSNLILANAKETYAD